MKRALLISIHPEWAEKILNGKKTIEVRSWIPKDYVGWVYVAITKGKPYLYNIIDSDYYSKPNILNGKVAFRFWFENYQTIKWEQNYYEYVAHDLLLNACLTNEQVKKYGKGKTIYAWHIDKLEIFDRPKELSEFNIYCNKHEQCKCDNCARLKLSFRDGGFDGEYCDNKLTKAPQKCAWVYIDEKPEPHQVSVLDEETPNKKDENERKPF